ncbi:iron(3+)-hydroxamate-binding protein fhuD [Paenibacillus sp. BIHB 4019]|uniref:Iron(3+)-hydroxamate-binding protein fhuD n=2 Tax=Paenibacillus sp. BIHB 4019 TaxID=1870819 RepID=A0A1B2DSB7_9BACL|nr:iron(3+)-hydroxamate-binding protein fhuD [Paenibacillus sp. BIHB 4019]
MFALLLAACEGNAGNGANDAGSATASEPAATVAPAETADAAAGDGETVTFKAANGDIEVPRDPQRIVDGTAFYTGYFLALGVTPVGVQQEVLASPYLKDKLAGAQSLGETPTPENVLALHPDLIVVFSGTEGIEELQKIAPVVAIDYGTKAYKEQLLEFGQLTNKEAEAQAWIEQWEAQINELKPKVQEAVGDKTVSILNPYEKGLYVFGHNYGRGGEIIYRELGLNAPEEAQKEVIDSGTGWASISLETLPQFAGDIIFTSPWSGDTADPKLVYENAVWLGLPAVKAGNVFQLDSKADTFNDPITMQSQLQYIADSLISSK